MSENPNKPGLDTGSLEVSVEAPEVGKGSESVSAPEKLYDSEGNQTGKKSPM